MGTSFSYIPKTRVKKVIMSITLALVLSVSIVAGNVMASGASVNHLARLYTTEYNSLEDVRDAVSELNKEIGAEGLVLLKNDNNTLPLAAGSRLSLFGKNSVDPVLKGSGSSGSVGGDVVGIVESLKSVGFKLNPALESFYKDTTLSGAARLSTGFSSYNYNSYFPTAETPQSAYTSDVKESYSQYNDAAVVVFSRTGGEGTDLPRSSFVKEADEGAVPTAANARAYPTRAELESGSWIPYGGQGRENTPFAHYLELDENEIDLLDEVTDAFSKVIVILNSSNAMELSREKIINNTKVQSVIFAPGGGQNAYDALGKILNGTINPSGRLVNTFAADFTKDPTWNNYSNNNVGYHGDGATGNSYTITGGADYSNNFNVYKGVYETSYEEGIYLGYHYYETRGYTESLVDGDLSWYEDNVIYPFGYGMSYTTFSHKVVNSSPSNGNSFGADTDISVKVKVTNTGNKEGKEVVQLYFSAPYTEGATEKSHVVLGAYAKTKLLKPNESDTVTLSFNAFDMASYDYNDMDSDGHIGYELDKGNYDLYIGTDANAWASSGSGKITLNLSQDINIDKDPISGADISNRFDDMNQEMEGRVLSRSDWDKTWPTTPLWFEVTNDTTVDPFWLAEMKVKYGSSFVVGAQGETPVYLPRGEAELVKPLEWLNNFDMPLIDGATQSNPVVDTWYDEQNPRYGGGEAPWYSATAPDFRSVSEQYSASNPAPIQLIDMYGVSLDDPKWDEFVSQLTVDQAYNAMEATMFQFNAQAAIGSPVAGHSDGPLGISGSWVGGGNSLITPMGSGSAAMKFTFATETLVACTWNDQIAEGQGKLLGELGLWTHTVGLYAPAANIHRSPFSGRNFEYYSECGVLSGKMLTAVTKGAVSKGMVVFLKHFVLNDQDSYRDTNGVATWAEEQTFRQIYAKPFEWAIKYGKANALMSSFNRLGFDWAGASYELLEELTRGEWGFEGVVITDAHGEGYGYMNGNQMIRAGNDMSLDSKAGFVSRITNTAEANTPTQLTALHKAMKNIYYTVLNSAAMKNGIDMTRVAYTAGTQYNSNSYSATNLATVKLGQILEDIDDVTVSDGGTSHQYIHMAGKLPEGLSIDRITGNITGRVSANAKDGVYKFTVSKAFEGIGEGEQWMTMSTKTNWQYLRVFSITVSNNFVFTGEDSKTVAPNQSFVIDASVMPLDGSTVTYEFSAPETVPTGVSINSSTGKIFGSIKDAGVYYLDVKATSDNDDVTNIQVAIYVGKLSYEASAISAGYEGINYTASVANAELTYVPNGTPVQVTYTIVGGELPEGLSLNSNGILTGVALEEGTYTFVVKADAGVFGSDTATYTLTVDSSLNLIGEPGIPGEQGPKGETGTPGIAGPTGPEGASAGVALPVVSTVMSVLALLGLGFVAFVIVKKK